MELYSTENWELKIRGNIHHGRIIGAVQLPGRYLNISSEHIHEVEDDEGASQGTVVCEHCEKEIEIISWLCPECMERVYTSRCPSCRRKSRHSYEYNGGTYYHCYDCGYSPRYIRDGR